MKKIGLISFLVIIAITNVTAQNQQATVYILRSIGHDLDQFVPYYAYLDKVLLCSLGEENYSVHEIESGDHIFHAQYKGKIKSTPETELLISVEPGKTYYISINLKTRAFGKGSFFCEQLSVDEGNSRVENYKRKIRCF